MSSFAHTGWRRYIALAILAFAFLDLSVPGLCRDELTGPQRDLPVATSDEQVSVVNAAPASQAPNDQQSADQDDCWCCCTHIAPARSAELSILAISIPARFALFEASRQGFADPVPHPPRA